MRRLLCSLVKVSAQQLGQSSLNTDKVSTFAFHGECGNGFPVDHDHEADLHATLASLPRLGEEMLLAQTVDTQEHWRGASCLSLKGYLSLAPFPAASLLAHSMLTLLEDGPAGISQACVSSAMYLCVIYPLHFILNFGVLLKRKQCRS